MTRPPFVLVTANPGKLVEARRLAGQAFDSAAVDLPEIQSLDFAEVLRAKAESAWDRLHRPLVVEDAGLELAALNGFPGPLVKWLLTAVGAEGIARTAAALGDLRATARCMLFYKDGDREVIAEGVTPGTLVLPGRGTHGFGWDPVFLPEGGDRTFAELDGAEKDAVSHRGKAWREMIGRLGGERERAG
jgi:non-canonical purine NTP pyrophosphatase (RdgB/HAM1 family)